MTLCHRCKKQKIRLCYLGDAASQAEFLGMCEPCYQDWLLQFPSYREEAAK